MLYSSINTPYPGHWQLLITCSGGASNKWCISKTNMPLNPNISVTIYFPPVSLLLLPDYFLFFHVVVAERLKPAKGEDIFNSSSLLLLEMRWIIRMGNAMLAFTVYCVRSLYKILYLSDCSNQYAMSECTLVFDVVLAKTHLLTFVGFQRLLRMFNSLLFDSTADTSHPFSFLLTCFRNT